MPRTKRIIKNSKITEEKDTNLNETDSTQENELNSDSEYVEEINKKRKTNTSSAENTDKIQDTDIQILQNKEVPKIPTTKAPKKTTPKKTTPKKTTPKKTTPKKTTPKKTRSNRVYTSTEDLFLLEYCAKNETTNWERAMIYLLEEHSSRAYSDLDYKSKKDRAKVSGRYYTLLGQYEKEYPKGKGNKESEEVIKHNWEKMQIFLKQISEREQKFTSDSIGSIQDLINERKKEEDSIRKEGDEKKKNDKKKARRLVGIFENKVKSDQEAIEEMKKQNLEDTKILQKFLEIAKEQKEVEKAKQENRKKELELLKEEKDLINELNKEKLLLLRLKTKKIKDN